MKSAILLILFNRPDLTEELFSIIEKNCEHRNIYIAIDGPRQNNESDNKLCSEVVRLSHNFACQYKDHCQLLVQKNNLGCGLGVKTAVDWLFENEEMGIILEDDCYPCDDFFLFQDEMLEKYKYDKTVYMVSGNCFIPNFLVIESIYLTKYSHIWGWGSWRRAWEKYEFTISEKDIIAWDKVIRFYCPENHEYFYWKRELDQLCGLTQPHTWDYQFQFSAWKNYAKILCPPVNLVINKGIRSDATNTKEIDNSLLPPLKKLPQNYSQRIINNEILNKIVFYFHILEGNSERLKWLFIDSDIDLKNLIHYQKEYSKGDSLMKKFNPKNIFKKIPKR